MKQATIKIETGIPMPPARRGNGIMATLRKIKIGKESFIWSKSLPNLYNYAKKVGIRIRIEKQPNGTHRVWRAK